MRGGIWVKFHGRRLLMKAMESMTFPTMLVSLCSCSESLLVAFWEKKLTTFTMRGKHAKTGLLYLEYNSLSFALGFVSIGPQISQIISELWPKIGSKIVSRTCPVLKGLSCPHIWLYTPHHQTVGEHVKGFIGYCPILNVPTQMNRGEA
jgi:hypothetical protein